MDPRWSGGLGRELGPCSCAGRVRSNHVKARGSPRKSQVGRESSQAAMPFMRNAESKRIQYLRRQLRRGHSEKGREFTEEDKHAKVRAAEKRRKGP